MLPVAPWAAGSDAVAAAYDPSRIGWQRLELEATKLFVTARSEVDLTRPPPATVASELIRPTGEAALDPRADGSYLIAIRTTVLGRESKVRFFFEPGDARALQRSELSLSRNRHRHRTYRYATSGVHSRTRRPAEGEESCPFSEWSRITESFIDYPTDLEPGVPVTEAAALLYAVPAADLTDAGDRTLLQVYSRRRVNLVDVEVAGLERIEVDYLEQTAAGERTVAEEVNALKVTLRPRPPAAGEERSFQLLGLEGDVDLYLDRASRTPLQVTGKIKIAGTVRLRLRRVVLR